MMKRRVVKEMASVKYTFTCTCKMGIRNPRSACKSDLAKSPLRTFRFLQNETCTLHIRLYNRTLQNAFHGLHITHNCHN